MERIFYNNQKEIYIGGDTKTIVLPSQLQPWGLPFFFGEKISLKKELQEKHSRAEYFAASIENILEKNMKLYAIQLFVTDHGSKYVNAEGEPIILKHNLGDNIISLNEIIEEKMGKGYMKRRMMQKGTLLGYTSNGYTAISPVQIYKRV